MKSPRLHTFKQLYISGTPSDTFHTKTVYATITVKLTEKVGETLETLKKAKLFSENKK